MSDAVFEPKLVYLARRHPSLDRAQFVARWRQHAKLGMSRPRWINIARYVHVDCVEPDASEIEVLDDHDAIGMIWHRSVAHRAAHLADLGSRGEMEADEAATFAQPILTTCLVAREETLVVPDAGAPWKLTSFVASDGLVATPEGTRGHVRNHPLPPERSAVWGLPARYVDEFWFETRGEAVAAARTIGPAPGSRLLLGQETLLYRA